MLHVYMKASNLTSQLPDILHNISYTNVTPDNQKGEENRPDTVTCSQPLRFKIEHDKHTNAISPEMVCVFFHCFTWICMHLMFASIIHSICKIIR